MVSAAEWYEYECRVERFNIAKQWFDIFCASPGYLDVMYYSDNPPKNQNSYTCFGDVMSTNFETPKLDRKCNLRTERRRKQAHQLFVTHNYHLFIEVLQL